MLVLKKEKELSMIRKFGRIRKVEINETVAGVNNPL